MIKGIWFFGLSGSGKTFASNYVKKKRISDSIIIDGDQVRKYVSSDLGYSLKDRLIQVNRIFGIAKILINQKKFPIVSTVYFHSALKNQCLKLKILPIRIVRTDMKKILKKHKTYINKINVVGVDIFYPKIKSKNILNKGDVSFCKLLDSLIP